MNFDILIDRTGTEAVKWEETDKTGGGYPVIPLWVADMDFPCPPAVTEALRKRAEHPVYGYTRLPPSFFETLVSWYRTRYQVNLEPDDFLAGPGTVPSLGITVRAFSRPGDGVLILSPVYHPFFDMIRSNGREAVEVPLIPDERGRYHFDEEALEQGLAAAKNRGLQVPMTLFCSPHNPGGAVWDREELALFLGFTRRHGMTVVSDEIHGDFVYSPKTFCSLASFPEHVERVIVVSGANKTFNLGGLHVSHFIVRDAKLTRALKEGCRAMAFHGPDIFSRTAAEAAYREGGPWFAELKAYIEGNITRAVAAINTGIPGLRACKPEGTYLIWVDASALIRRGGFRNDAEFTVRLEEQGRVKVTPGSAFGSRGQGFIRINAACPREQLLEGVFRIKAWGRDQIRLPGAGSPESTQA
ncbi:MAG: PatB family C-S lyase [Spirochaetaceae bacterium]|nr:PatB family C-S lyase [Spirochaetaceae bacterium]